MIDNSKEYIICAAIRRIKPKSKIQPYHEGTNDICNIELGYRHHDIYQRFGKQVSGKMVDQGFYTSKGRFVDRIEGMEIAYNAGQVDEKRALSKEWMKLKISDRDEEYWKEHYKHKFNMLFSEDIY